MGNRAGKVSRRSAGEGAWTYSVAMNGKPQEASDLAGWVGEVRLCFMKIAVDSMEK